MNYILLVGAGFTRNWGGWLAKELEGDLLARLANDPQLRRLVQSSSNYEEALEMARSPSVSGVNVTAEQLKSFEAAIRDSFWAMNMALYQRGSIDLSQDDASSIHGFLGRFDAIFTLNQDLLLELHYNPKRSLPIRWSGTYYPGIEPATMPDQDVGELVNITRRVGTTTIAIPDRQPIYKLHGSVDWTDGTDSLFVVGGGKESYIRSKPILTQYFDLFRECLSRPHTRFMIIGYGWADDHVNRLIFDTSKANTSLGIFHVHPEGRDAVHRGGGQPVVQYSAPTLASLRCVGESRRPLSSTFAGDTLEYHKLMRFFS